MIRNLCKELSALTHAIREASEHRKIEFEWFKSHHDLATKLDLKETEKLIDMKLSEIKAAIATAAAQNSEAFAELGTKIADLNKQIEDLIAGSSDPDVTDEAFLADLETLKTNAAALAAIVPNPEPPPA